MWEEKGNVSTCTCDSAERLMKVMKGNLKKTEEQIGNRALTSETPGEL